MSSRPPVTGSGGSPGRNRSTSVRDPPGRLCCTHLDACLAGQVTDAGGLGSGTSAQAPARARTGVRGWSGRLGCTRLDACLAPQVTDAGRPGSGTSAQAPARARTASGCGRTPDGCATRSGRPGLRGTAAEGRVRSLDAYPRGLGLGHAEPLEDVQRLPEDDPRRIVPLRAERRFRDSFEDLGLLVGIADLPRQLQRGAIMIKRLAVPASSAPDVGYPPKRDHLLGQAADLLGNRSRLLVMNQRLVKARRALVNGADVIEHIRFIREIADVTVDREGPPARSETLLVTALVMVDAANIVIQDRLALRGA